MFIYGEEHIAKNNNYCIMFTTKNMFIPIEFEIDRRQ